MKRADIITNSKKFINDKITELAVRNPLFNIGKPFITTIINNNIDKVDDFMKLLEDKNGDIDIKGIFTEVVNNLLVNPSQYYPDLFGGITIGDGEISMNVPLLNKKLIINSKDINTFIQQIAG